MPFENCLESVNINHNLATVFFYLQELAVSREWQNTVYAEMQSTITQYQQYYQQSMTYMYYPTAYTPAIMPAANPAGVLPLVCGPHRPALLPSVAGNIPPRSTDLSTNNDLNVLKTSSPTVKFESKAKGCKDPSLSKNLPFNGKDVLSSSTKSNTNKLKIVSPSKCTQSTVKSATSNNAAKSNGRKAASTTNKQSKVNNATLSTKKAVTASAAPVPYGDSSISKKVSSLALSGHQNSPDF